MKNELDSKFVLRVFDKIRQEGEEQEGKYRLEGVVAYTDFDGYTLYINDAKVAMQFGFHNQYHFDYQKSDDFDDFEKSFVISINLIRALAAGNACTVSIQKDRLKLQCRQILAAVAIALLAR